MGQRRLNTVHAQRVRDLKILELLSDGNTAREVGGLVGLSEGRVNARVLAMRRELRVRNTAALVAAAIRTGLIR